jgi:3D (Asp-Asp-Asp) domain-containing protein
MPLKIPLLLALLVASAEPASAATRLALRVTGYRAGPCRRCGTTGITATGRNASRTRGLAVARRAPRRAVPLGRRVYVRGHGWLRVDDVGGGVRSNQLDLRFRRHRDAQRWGARVLRVAVRR